MFLLNICIGTCFKENIWVFVDSYSNPHWHWAPAHRLSQLSQYLNILDPGASPVQCCWCCWCCWLLLWVGGVRRWLWKADSVLWTELSSGTSPGALLSVVDGSWRSEHLTSGVGAGPLSVWAHLETGVSALCQQPLVTNSDQTQHWPLRHSDPN